MKKIGKKNNLYFFYVGLISLLFVSAFFVSVFQKNFALAQESTFLENTNPVTRLLTEPFLRIRTNTSVDGFLNARGAVRSPVFDIISQNTRGRVYTSQLTEERRYVFPDLSGEICLTAGNCDFAPGGIPDRLAKFTADGLVASSITDENNLTGVGITNPAYRLHVDGRIHASGDVCTDLGGEICLSSIGEGEGEGQEIFSDSIVDGEGNTSYVPLWRSNQSLGDSIIYQSEDNIGIGTVPTTKLDGSGTVRMLGFRLPVNPTEGYGLMTDDRGHGSWKPVLTPEGTAADIAERFSVDPHCKERKICPEPGDLVSITENEIIKKASSPYESSLIGIVSTEPEMTLNAKLDPDLSRPVALIGRVPTKVSLENGEVKAGDLITSSSTPGIAMKAMSSGRVVGIALENLSFKETEKGVGTINVLINPHYNNVSSLKESLILKDKKTGKDYCIEVVDGKLKNSLCE